MDSLKMVLPSQYIKYVAKEGKEGDEKAKGKQEGTEDTNTNSEG